MHDTYIITPYFHVEFCEYDTRTILPASMGFNQAHPNYFELWYSFIEVLLLHICTYCANNITLSHQLWIFCLSQAVNSLGFVSPTPIQASTIPVALLGKDICASAATGTGEACNPFLPLCVPCVVVVRQDCCIHTTSVGETVVPTNTQLHYTCVNISTHQRASHSS